MLNLKLCHIRGKSFGLGFKSYYNNFYPNSLGRTIKYDATETPGPGKYHIQKSTGSESKKITISNRNTFIDLNAFKIAPNAYKLNHC